MIAAPPGPAHTEVDTRRARRLRAPLFLSGMVLACVAVFHTPATAATRTAPQATSQPLGVSTTLSSAHTTLDAFMEDLNRVLPPAIVREHEFRAGTVPHALVYFEGAELAEAVQAAGDLARNYGLNIETQWAEGPGWEAGLIVSPHFPTISLCWEAHPFEDVPTAGGLWRQPFADLGDVVALSKQGETNFLQLDPQAVQRIDLQSARQGHRRFFIRSDGQQDGFTLGPYSWMKGLERVPLSAGRSGDGISEVQIAELVKRMMTQFAERTGARARLAERLGLGANALWTAPPERPRYRESFVLWAIEERGEHGDVPAYAPWFGATGPERRWVALRVGAPEAHSAAVPEGWRLETGGDETLALVRDTAGAASPALGRFLRHHVGCPVALLMDGEVIGTGTIDGGGTQRLALTSNSEVHTDQIAARWESERGATTAAAGSALLGRLSMAEAIKPAPVQPAIPDFFQVRLMAEPQERKLIPVTHFAAPGAGPGVRVAVQNDVILDSRSVTGARLEQQADRLTLHLSLTDEGRDALSDACFTNLGKQLAIVYEDTLLCAPTIVDWEQEELSFKGMSDDWPQVAEAMAERLGNS